VSRFRPSRFTLPALLALAISPGRTAAQARPPDAGPPRLLRVTGEGRASAAPDVAVASFGVETSARVLADASQETDSRMRRILEALKAAGVALKDVQTTRYDVGIERRPDPKGGEGQVSGYRVATEVRATVRQLARVGSIIDAVVKAGSNQVHSLAFLKDDPTPERNRALAAAVASARAKAEEMAKAAGVQLGEVREVIEGGAAPLPRMPRVAMMAATTGAPVEAGELEYTAQVEVTFSIR
jgi:uncharacterized protein